MENDKYFLFSPFNFPLSTSTSCYTNVPSANGWNIGPKQHQTKNISFTLTATCVSPGASSTAGWTTWPKGLIAIGVERGTHVGIWAANVPDWLTLLYACAKIGAVYVTVNTNYKQSELEYLCQNSDMHTLCIVNGEKDSDFVQMTYTMLPELKTCQRGRLKSERFPYMKNVIYVGQGSTGACTTRPKYFSWATI